MSKFALSTVVAIVVAAVVTLVIIMSTRPIIYHYQVQVLDSNFKSIVSLELPAHIDSPYKIGDTIISSDEKIWIVQAGEEDVLINASYCRIIQVLSK